MKKQGLCESETMMHHFIISNESKSIHCQRLDLEISCFQTVCISFVPHQNSFVPQIVTHEYLLKIKMKRFASIKIMLNFEMQSHKISWVNYKVIIEKFIWIIRKHLWRPYVNFIQLSHLLIGQPGEMFRRFSPLDWSAVFVNV